MIKRNQKNIAAVDHIIRHCGNVLPGERVLILCNPATRDLAEAFLSRASVVTRNARLIEMPLASSHGDEPSTEANKAMIDSDLIISLCLYSLAHSSARREAAAHGSRFLSLPMYSWELLDDEAVCVDYYALRDAVDEVARRLSGATRIRVTTDQRPDLTLCGVGRTANACPGYVKEAGDLGSPPDVEANIAPIETDTEGVIVVDGSITTPEIGLLSNPLTLFVTQGRVVEIDSECEKNVTAMNRLLGDKSSGRRVVGELGVGLNPKAKLTGIMLTDEGCSGCVHFGLGSNSTIGGTNNAGYHLDVVVRDATLDVDGCIILEKGRIMI